MSSLQHKISHPCRSREQQYEKVESKNEDVQVDKQPMQEYFDLPPETSEQRLARRKAQLIAFYNYWDPDKGNIEDHVENLFQRHDFKFVARAVRTKYGLVPPGWDEELAYEEDF